MDPVAEVPEDNLPPLTDAQIRGAEQVRPPISEAFGARMPAWIPHCS